MTHLVFDDTQTIRVMEQVIRDHAANVVNAVQMRSEHPTYGYGKTDIRNRYQQMQGMIGLYMVVTGQANHAGVPLLAEFDDAATAQRVQDAGVAIGGL